MNKAPFLIDAYGDWYYMGSKITRTPMIKLFSSILVKDKDNTFHLRTPVEDVLVEVIDVPYVITSMDRINNNNLTYFTFTTNVGVQFTLGKRNPIWVEAKENSDEFVTLMQKASFDMTQLAKAIDTAEDLRAVQKELMWNNCSACHKKFRAEH